MTPQRRGRRGQRGSAAIIVAIGSVALLAITGLALDGGMEAGAFRHAQNAADAGALEAARQIYLNAAATPQKPSDSSTLTYYAQREVQHNNAQLAWVTSTWSTNVVTAMNGGGGGGKPVAQAPPSSSGSGVQTMDIGGIGYSYTFAAATPSAVTSGQTVYAPTNPTFSAGSTAQAAVADVWATAGTALTPVDAHIQTSATQSTATMAPPGSSPNGGSVASSQIDLGETSVPSQNVDVYVDCWQAQAAYHAGQTTPGVATGCPTSGVAPAGVNISGTLLTSPDNGVQVDGNNAPTAKPRMMALDLNAVNGPVTVTAAEASSSNDLYWDPVTGVTAMASVNATSLHLATSALTADTTSMLMTVRSWVDPSSGTPHASMTCKPTTVVLTNILNGAVDDVSVDQNCVATGLGSLGLNNVTMPWTQPAPVTSTTACSTNTGTGVISCSVQSCFLKVTVNANPYNSTVCLGLANVSLSAMAVQIPCSGTTSCCPSPPCGSGSPTPTPTPTSCVSDCGGGSSSLPTAPSSLYPQFTGAVTVAASVAQPTYFLRVLGWSQTTPTAQATADVENVVDEPQAQFALSPFAMPDTATAQNGQSERLQVGHTYYLYGPLMQSNSPAASMPSNWQGQLDSGSAHRVGNTLTGSSLLTTTPQLYDSTNKYYLEPVFEPVSGVVEFYGVFVPTGQANWATLVNSVPNLGYIVQANSEPGWITFNEGAVSVKLIGNPGQ